MHKDTAVCTFSYNLRRRSVCDLDVMRPAEASWGASISQGVVDPLQLSWWISYRYIPTGRAGLSDILRGAGCADPASLLFKTLVLNLSDQYRIRPADLPVSWGEVNYFDNPYVDGHAVWTATDGVHVRMGPGSATSGQLAKHWESRAGHNVLVKGSSSADCHEPWAEELTRRPLPYDARVFDNAGASPLGHVRDFSWIDFDALRAFAPTVEELLAQSRHPAWFAPAAKAQYLLRVAELESFARGRA